MPRIKRALAVLAALVLPLAATAPASAKAHPPPAPLSCQVAHHNGKPFGGGVTEQEARPVSVAVPDPNPLSCIDEVGSENAATYYLESDGTLWATGLNSHGELGDGTTTESLDTAVQVIFPPQPDGSPTLVRSIPADAMPYDSGLAIGRDGNLYGWGYNKGGEFCTGTPTTTNYLTPVELTAFPAPVTLVAGADQHLHAVADGVLYGCGQGTAGSLGDGNTRNTTVPVVVKGFTDASDVAGLDESQENGLLWTTSGQVEDWGLNSWGQLGDGTLKNSDVPVAVSLPAAATQVVQGGDAPSDGQVLALLANGQVMGWGNDQFSQLGDGGTGNEDLPVLALLLPFTPAMLASGGATSYAIDAAGNEWAWGNGTYGQLGNGTTTTAQADPVEVDSGAGLISSTANVVVVGAPSLLGAHKGRFALAS
jgi:alpha-tubulin suppressor-like RCC1 family protein